jgi:DNA (cytosine-5)-methyltransferase 1
MGLPQVSRKAKMRHASLFSGIGGFDLAAEWMGWENVFHCEWMEFPRKVLDYYWPNADSHIDICKTDFKKYANTIDILTGGFPCQPFSTAGKRKGTDDERYLWGEMLRAVQEIKPTYVIAENVFGITNIDGGLVFEQVCLDLEAEGYEVQPFIIPAASKSAPHRRDRVWFIAYSNGDGLNERNSNDEINSSKTGKYAQCNIKQIHNEQPIAKYPDLQRQKRRLHKEQSKTTTRKQFSKRNAWGVESANWKNYPTQPPICGGDDGLPTELDGITFSKWRSESIKGYGNAIVPQVALEIFKQISPRSQ